MKKRNRFLSILLAVLMLISSVSISMPAFAAFVTADNYNSVDKAVLTPQQAATLLLDYADKSLAESGTVITQNIPLLGDLVIDTTSVNGILKSLDDVAYYLDKAKGIPFSDYLIGDLTLLHFDAIKGKCRGDGNKDLQIIKGLIQFANDSRGFITKAIDGSINLGFLDSFVDINEMIGDITEMIKGYLYEFVVYREGYPTTYAVAKYSDKFKTADALINTLITDMLTKPSTFDSSSIDTGALLSTVSSFLSFLGLPVDLSGLSITDITKMITELLGIPGAEAVPALSPGAVILPSLQSSKIDLTANSLYNIIEHLINTAYTDLLVLPLNNGLKQLLVTLSGAKINEITNKSLITTLSGKAPKKSNAISNTDFFKYNNKYYVRTGETYYEVLTDSTNAFYGVINWDYTFKNTLGELGASTDFAANANKLLVAVAKTVFTQSAFNSIGLANGGNENLNENINKLLKFILPKIPAETFGTNFDTSLLENIEDKSLEQLAALLLRGMLETQLPSLIIPASVQTLEEMAVLAIREVLLLEAPHLKFDNLIFGNVSTLTMQAKSESEWRELLFDMFIDAAVFYLDQYAGLDLDAADVLAKKNAGWTSVDFLDEIVDWALSYTKGILTVTDTLNLTRGQKASSVYAPWDKLNKVIADVIDLSFINGADGHGYTFDTEKVLKEKVLGNLLDLNSADAVNMFVRNTENNNILNDSIGMRGLLTAVNKVIKAVLGAGLNPNNLTSAEKLIKQEGLKDIVNTLLNRLNIRSNELLNAVLPYVASALPDVLTEQRFGSLDIDSPDYVVISGTSAKATVKVTHNTVGVPDSYIDGSRKVDSDYVVTVKSYKTSAVSGSTSVNKTLLPGKSLSFDVTLPSSAKGTVKLTVDYSVKGPNGVSLGDFSEYRYIYVADKAGDDVPKKLSNNVTGPKYTFVAKSEFSKLSFVKFSYKAPGSTNTLILSSFKATAKTSANAGFVEAGFTSKSVVENNTVSVNPYKLKSGVAYDPKFEGRTEISQKYNSETFTTYIYVYNDYDLIPLFNRLIAFNYNQDDFAQNFTYTYTYNGKKESINSNTAWSNYNDALIKAAGLVLQPKFDSTVKNITDQYKAAYDSLLRASEILKQCPYKVNSPYDVLNKYLKDIEPSGKGAYSAVDYQRYRWTKFSTTKLLADTIISQKTLANPDNRLYLPGVNLTTQELKNIVNNSSQKYRDVIKLYDDYTGSLAGIAASVGNMLTQSLIFKSVHAADAKNLLGMYKDRMEKAKAYTAVDKTFLSAAIDYANSLGISQEAYADMSFRAFERALDAAATVMSIEDITQTEVNNVRTELLKAIGSLILKTELVSEDDIARLIQARQRAYNALDKRDSLRVNPEDWTAILEAAGLTVEVSGKSVQLYPKSVGALETELKNTPSTLAEINRRIDKLNDLVDELGYKLNANITLVSSADVDSALAAGKTFTVQVKLGTDYKLQSASIPVYYNKAIVKYKSASGNATAVTSDGLVKLKLDSTKAGNKRYANDVIATLTFETIAASNGQKLIWVENKASEPISAASVLTEAAASTNIILDGATLTFKAATAVTPSYGGTIVRGGTKSVADAYKDEKGNYTAADFRIVTEISQQEAYKFFGIPKDKTSGVVRSPIVELGTVIAFADYMKNANLSTLTLNNVDNKNVFSAASNKVFYTNRAKADGSGSFYWATTIVNVPREKWNTKIFAVGYIKYLDANGKVQTVYTTGQTVSLSVESVSLVK